MKRMKWITALVAAFFLLATVAAVAAWISSKTTATDTFNASAIGSVDIGNGETVSLFDSVNVADLDPGDSMTACWGVAVDATNATGVGDFRLYADAIGGTGLADYLNLEIGLATNTISMTGELGCGGSWEFGTAIFDDTLTTFGTSHGAYANGLALATPAAGGTEYVGVWLTISLPDTPAVNAGAQGLSGSMSVTFENQ